MNKRTPIVTILGHVDHGKTTLLDYIRKSNIASGEAGGITQAIGAYKINHNGNEITFVDTPGHAAFSKMRAHGAQVADLAILVIAADDGVMPQTEDAIKHIKEAEIPFVVAINKIDTEGANVQKTKNDLIKSEVYLEGMGGDVSYQEISALKGEGIDDLLDLVNLLSEVEDITYDSEKKGEGIILTSNCDSHRGVIVGVIVKDGVIKKGDKIFSESTEGKIKILENSLGEKQEEIKAGSPALIIGFDDVPETGEIFRIDEKPEQKKERKRKILRKVEKDDERIKVIIKTSESGCLEVVAEMVDRLSKDLPVVLMGGSVGDICEGDLKDASSFNALIVGFETSVDKAAMNLAKTQEVDIITSDIIYKLEDELKEYIENNTEKEKRLLKILAVFGKKEGGQQIIGGEITKGYVENNESFEIISNDKKIGEGRIINLQMEREDIQKGEEGEQVGMLVKADCKISVDDVLAFS
jgi:translation initiation factor IF-2